MDGITLAFGGIKALTGVGFRVQPGSITTVIGPNGAGKTSLFNTISGFYHPAAGQIRFQGADITRKPAPERARLGLARSFQNISLFRGMTVLDNIKLGCHAHLRSNVLDALLYLGRARARKWRCAPRSRTHHRFPGDRPHPPRAGVGAVLRPAQARGTGAGAGDARC